MAHFFDQFVLAFLKVLAFGWIGALFASWIWAIGKLWRRESFLEGQPRFPLVGCRWNGLIVFTVILVYLAVNLFVRNSYTRVFPHDPAAAALQAQAVPKEVAKATVKRGEQAPVAGKALEPLVVDQAPEFIGPPKPRNLDDQGDLTQTEILVINAIASSLLLILIPLMLRLFSGARLSDIGMHFQDFWKQVQMGMIGAFLATPLILVIQAFAVRIWTPEQHAVQKALEQEFSYGGSLLALSTAVILAPMLEELLFRGILQRWLTSLLNREPASPSPAWDRVEETDRLGLSSDETGGGNWWETSSEPMSFEASKKVSASPSVSPNFSFLAIVITSALFAALHMPQWPSPIGIFCLAVCLGFLFQATGSLIASITMHAVFNSFSTIVILLVAFSKLDDPAQAMITICEWLGLWR